MRTIFTIVCLLITPNLPAPTIAYQSNEICAGVTDEPIEQCAEICETVCTSRHFDLLVPFVMLSEGFEATAYPDGYTSKGKRRYSYGYGTKAPHSNATITQPKAAELLVQHLERLCFHETLTVLDDHWQRMVLVSSLYNLGSFGPNLQKSIRANDTYLMQQSLQLYVNFNGEPLAGLVTRRARECRLLAMTTEQAENYIKTLEDGQN